MLRNASQVILERANNVSMSVNDFLDKLNDLVNQSAIANNMSDETNAILARHMPPVFQVGVLLMMMMMMMMMKFWRLACKKLH